MKKQIFLVVFLGLTYCQFAQTPLDSALIACYPFSGNANDLTGNGNNGTVNGAVLTADRFGNPNAAYSFNGVNQNIAIPGFNAQITSNEHSISFWATATGYATRSAFLMVPDDPSNRYNVHIYYGNMFSNSQTFWDFGSIYSNGRLSMNGSPLPSSGAWDHWVFVTSATGSVKRCYKNGSLLLTSAGNSTFNNSTPKDLLIGGGVGTGSSYLWFDGKIDDIRIYRRALTQSDVTALYTSTAICNFCTQAVAPVNTTPLANLQVCAGGMINLSATGSGTINWQSSAGSTVSAGTGNNFSVPATSVPGTITMYATNTNSCSVSPQITITATVHPLPAISVSGANAICKGASVILTASGASTYSWSNGIANGVAFSPAATTTYNVSGTNSFGCTNTAVHTVSVNPLPQINIIPSSSVLCIGNQATLTALGAATYTWNVNLNSPSIVVAPLATAVYSVSGKDQNGCVNSATVSVIVQNCVDTGIEQVKTATDTSIYPNPNTGEFKIAFSHLNENCRVEIYNPLGQLVYQAKLQEKVASVALKHLAKGIYTVKLYQDAQLLRQDKVVVE